MSRQFFGTDGIRGRVGEEPMTAEFALRLASAAARVLAPEGGRVCIGKDTRVSGYMFESALEAGFVAAGMDVLLLGPLPTPGIAYMTQALEADLGVVISASHNPYCDNGIKFFDRQGAKLPDAVEEQIETFLSEPAITRDSGALGRAKRVESSREDYERFCLSTVPRDLRLDNLKLVVDCSHGASYKVAPRVLTALGAEIVPIGQPDVRRLCATGQLQMVLDGPGPAVDVGADLPVVDQHPSRFGLRGYRGQEGGQQGQTTGATPTPARQTSPTDHHFRSPESADCVSGRYKTPLTSL